MDFLVRKCRLRRPETSHVSNKRSEQEGSPELADGPDVERLDRKAGYLTIQDRVKCLADRQTGQENKTSLRSQDVRSAPQYANLYELFSSKTANVNSISDKTRSDTTSLYHEPRKARIPVMKLSKDDWNVRCWEERLKSHRKRQLESARRPDVLRSSDQADKLIKVDSQRLQVFKGRIEDVAAKLDKVREGIPMDDKLFELSTNRCKEIKNSHEWTDMLKSELQKGTHNPRQLNSEIALIGGSPGRQMNSYTVRTTRVGRPIRRMFQDDDDDDEDNIDARKSNCMCPE